MHGGSNNGAAGGGGAVGGQVSGGVMNMADAGPPGQRIEGDTKDVTASHMTNNSHNEMHLHFGGQNMVQPQ